MDWFSRYVLSWRLSTSLHADSCVDALEEALDCYGKPEIFNTDQGSQFTGEAFTTVLIGATPEEKKELIGFQAGYRESAQSWRELLIDLKSRGLAVAPELAIGNGLCWHQHWQCHALCQSIPRGRPASP